MSAAAATPRRVRPPAKPRKRAMWRDPAGQVSYLKIATLVLMVVPALWLTLAWRTGALGSRYVTEAEREIGEYTIRFLLLSLAVTPARFVLDWPRIVLVRRMVGVTCAAYAVAHLALYAVDQNWRLDVVASEIAKRFYLAVGFLVLLGLLALAASSTDAAMRRMGRSWKGLHRVLYFLGLLALWHYALQSKNDVSDAMATFGCFAWLMLWRVLPRRWRGMLWVLPMLALAAAALTAGVEAAWYAVASRIDPWRVLGQNVPFDPEDVRPAHLVFAWGMLVFVVAGLRRLVGWAAGRIARRRAAT